MSNVEIVVEDEPPPGSSLLGLYQGVPLTRRGAYYGGVLPDKITIYRRPLERLYGSDPSGSAARSGASSCTSWRTTSGSATSASCRWAVTRAVKRQNAGVPLQSRSPEAVRQHALGHPPHLERAMAKSGVRVAITLACTECKRRNYQTMKSKRNTPDRVEFRKYCRWCGMPHTAPGDPLVADARSERHPAVRRLRRRSSRAAPVELLRRVVGRAEEGRVAGPEPGDPGHRRRARRLPRGRHLPVHQRPGVEAGRLEALPRPVKESHVSLVRRQHLFRP